MSVFVVTRSAAYAGAISVFGCCLLLTGCSSGGHVISGSTSNPTSAAGASLAQQGPELGFLWSSSEQSLRPILGVTGASQFGPPVVEAGTYLAAGASARSGEAILEDKSGEVSLMSVPGGTPIPLSGVHLTGTAQFVFSPSGANAVVFVPGQSTVFLLMGLESSPQAPGVQALSGGVALAAVAVSDTGQVVAASGSGPTTLTLLTGNGAPVASLGGLGGIAFLPGGSDLLAMDTVNGVLRLIPGSAISGGAGGSIAGGGSVAQSFTSSAFRAPFAVAASQDGRTAVVANGADSSVVRVDLTNATGPMRIPCTCKVDRLTPLAGNAVFALSGPGAAPAWMVDASTSLPRTLFIPAMVNPMVKP